MSPCGQNNIKIDLSHLFTFEFSTSPYCIVVLVPKRKDNKLCAMKDIYQLDNLLNLTSEINHPLNKTHRIKVSSARRCDAVSPVISIFFFVHSTLVTMRRRISSCAVPLRAAFTYSNDSRANFCN